MQGGAEASQSSIVIKIGFRIQESSVLQAVFWSVLEKYDCGVRVACFGSSPIITAHGASRGGRLISHIYTMIITLAMGKPIREASAVVAIRHSWERMAFWYNDEIRGAQARVSADQNLSTERTWMQVLDIGTDHSGSESSVILAELVYIYLDNRRYNRR